MGAWRYPIILLVTLLLLGPLANRLCPRAPVLVMALGMALLVWCLDRLDARLERKRDAGPNGDDA